MCTAPQRIKWSLKKFDIWPKPGVKDPALGQMSNFFGRAFNV